MKFLEKIWDDSMGGPAPEKGLGKFRKSKTVNATMSSGDAAEGGDSGRASQAIPIANASKRLYLMRSQSMEGSPPSSPSSSSPSSTPRGKDNVWRSVFNPGSNLNTNHIGSEKFDKADPRSPTVYDWLYSGDTRNKWR
eukprot:TRINITY_DN439_c0_g1_i5.p1 TRINITY_DN439_c0_g1~~TRINITY_DN439_c0_g1_i5.p1  ORF type:complete len:138 (-),score=30.75 TRINITY_DN439_c0_g1_i5:316-729(-)